MYDSILCGVTLCDCIALEHPQCGSGVTACCVTIVSPLQDKPFVVSDMSALRRLTAWIWVWQSWWGNMWFDMGASVDQPLQTRVEFWWSAHRGNRWNVISQPPHSFVSYLGGQLVLVPGCGVEVIALLPRYLPSVLLPSVLGRPYLIWFTWDSYSLSGLAEESWWMQRLHVLLQHLWPTWLFMLRMLSVIPAGLAHTGQTLRGYFKNLNSLRIRIVWLELDSGIYYWSAILRAHIWAGAQGPWLMLLITQNPP